MNLVIITYSVMEMKSEQIDHQQRKAIQCNVIGFSDYDINIINILK